MANFWTPNGILVQSKMAKLNTNIKYLGISSYECWPLAICADEKAIALTQEAEERWFGYMYDDGTYPLAVVPTLEYIERYLGLCNVLGIHTRLLLIESERVAPRFDAVGVSADFLGYDYVTTQEFFSSVEDDLFGLKTVEPQTKYTDLLNQYGLFTHETDLEAYIHDRNELISNGYDLESHGDFCKIRMSLILK